VTDAADVRVLTLDMLRTTSLPGMGVSHVAPKDLKRFWGGVDLVGELARAATATACVAQVVPAMILRL